MRRTPLKRTKTIFKQNAFVQTDSGPLSFLLSRSRRRRSFSIMIHEQARVEVAAPHFVSDEAVFDFIRKKQKWIFAKLDEARRNQALINSKRFDDGHEFLFLGRAFPLKITEQDMKRPQLDFNGLNWQVKVPAGLKESERERVIKTKMLQWYRERAHDVLAQRVLHYSRLMNVQPRRVGVRSFKTLWGNCDYRKQSVQFNWQIILSPSKVIDYVVVHELSHLIHPNHSTCFWKKVEELMPDFREHREWLRKQAAQLTLP